jgi:hypothetical protein
MCASDDHDGDDCNLLNHDSSCHRRSTFGGAIPVAVIEIYRAITHLIPGQLQHVRTADPEMVPLFSCYNFAVVYPRVAAFSQPRVFQGTDTTASRLQQRSSAGDNTSKAASRSK